MHTIERPGQRPAVVCIHGYCQSSTYWTPTLDRMAERGVHALAMDLPGFGQSASESGPYDLESLADAVEALCERKGIGRIVLVGGSMGGVVAQHLVLRHPMRASRLLLVSTGAFTADSATALARADAIAAGEWNDAAVEAMIKGFFRNPPPVWPKNWSRRKNLYFHWAIALAGGPELGTIGSKLASSNFADFLDLPIAACRFAGSEFRG